MNNYLLKELYKPGMDKLVKMGVIIDSYIEAHLPRIWRIFTNQNLQSLDFASNWLLTLFSYDMAPRLSIKIFDLFLVKRWPIIAGLVLSLFTLFDRNFN